MLIKVILYYANGIILPVNTMESKMLLKTKIALIRIGTQIKNKIKGKECI